MSIQRRFILLLGVLLLGFAAAWGWLGQLQRNEAEAAYADARQMREQLLSHLLDLGGKSLPQSVASHAQMDWEIPGVSPADREKIARDLANEGMQAFWLLESDGTPRFRIDAANGNTPAPPPIPAADIADLMLKSPTSHFFVLQGSDLLEIGLARTTSRQSGGKNTSVMLARRWDDQHLGKLASLTDSEVTLVWPDQAVPTAPGKTVILRPLADWQGRTLRLLRAEQTEAGLERILQTDARPARVFIMFGLLIVIALALALHTWVLRPLRQIGKSLAGEKPSELGTLSKEKNELGGIARLVESSFAQSQALKFSEESLRRTLEERVRLGRDLHDGVIQSLYAAGMGLASIKMTLSPEQTEIISRLEQTRAILNETIHDLRNFITGLEPEALKQKTFGQAVTALLATMQAVRPLKAKVDINDQLASRLSLVQRVHALQVIREAVSNALRHGDASTVSVALRENAGAAEFEISDDGCGFDPLTATSLGFGMSNLFERARDLDGELVFDSALGKGTRVKLIFDFPS